MRAILISLMLAAAGSFGLGQSSASYNISDYAFNDGGHPESGMILTSASYGISLDAIGESISGDGVTSGSYLLDGSFVRGYAPPGEIDDLMILGDRETLEWSPEMSVGVYNVYRGTTLPDPTWPSTAPEYGKPFDCDVDPWTTGETAHDPWVPSPGTGGYYLVTAENRLGEEGTMGLADPEPPSGDRQPTAPCP